MIDPSNITKIYDDGSEMEIIFLDNIPDFDKPEYMIETEKDFNKFIDQVEKVVRASMEYRDMVTYLRENLNMGECAFFKNVNNYNNPKIRIEIHHAPFNLWEICKTVVNKRIAYGETMEIEIIAKEVMILHYKMMVGLIPLSETVHELVHNMYLFIPIEKVFGRYMDFYNMYQDFIPIETKDTFDRILEMSKVYNEEEQKSVLRKKYVYIDATGSFEAPKYDEILSALSKRIDELKRPNTVTNDNGSNNKVIKEAPIFYMNPKEEDNYGKSS